MSAVRKRRNYLPTAALFATIALIFICGALADAAAASGAAHTASMKLVAEAESLIRQAGSVNPPDTGKVNRARELLEQATRLDPRNDAAYVDLGFCWSALSYPQAAIEAYNRAVEINPSAANFKELADIYMRVGSSEKALMAANAGLAKNPNDAPLWNAKGMALSDMARYREAAAAFKQALKIDPNFSTAYANLVAVDPDFKGRDSVSK